MLRRQLIALTLSFAWLAVPARALAQDPGTAGPLAVTVDEYNFGDTAFTPAGFPGPVELRASVHRPSDLSTGPFPLVVLLHGRHSTCTDGTNTFMEWPCSAGRTTIPSFQGYSYMSSILASHGYIVISLSANGINAKDSLVADLGAQARAELIQRHLDRWDVFNSTGAAPFGSTFVGRVDLSNVGTMGHSRGGEGVMRHVLYNRSQGSPYGIRAVFALAPVDFSRPVINGVPFEVLLPYCDGDVSDLQGVHFYDDARYSSAGDTARKHYVLVMGANHNFYNTVWTSGYPGAVDDWGSVGDSHCDAGQPRRLTAAKQRGTGLAYMTGFFRRYLGGETQFDAMLRGDVPAPPSAQTNDLFSSYHAPDSATERRDVNRYQTSTSLTANQTGGAVTPSGFTPNDLCGGPSPQPAQCNASDPTSRQPHTAPSFLSSAPGLSQLRGGYSTTSATYTNALAAGARDVSGFRVLQFRIATNYADARNAAGVSQDFVVRLTDGSGAFADALMSTYSGVLFYPPGSYVAEVPKVVQNTARIPLTAFGGINLSDVRSIQFRFNQRASGAFLLSDVAFADAATPSSFPDIAEPTVSNTTTSVTQGGSFSVSDTTQNTGSAGAGSSTTRYYLSLDTAKSGGDVLLTGSRSVAALAAGASSSGSAAVTVPGATAVGTYFVLACGDDTAIVAESNEGNNCRATTTTVQVQSATPDLVEAAVSNPPATVTQGGSFPVTDTAQNIATVGAGTSTTRYYLSLDTAKSGADVLLTGSRSVVALAAGASSSGTVSVTVPTATALGTYFVLACADDSTVVVESNESNNCLASSTTVQVQSALPDLVETAVSNPPVTVTQGGSFAVTDTAQNTATVGAGTSTTRYYLSLDAAKSAGDALLTGGRSVALAAGASSSGTVSVAVPAATALGTYFLLACADDTAVVAESNESNNCRASTTTVQVQSAPPDLVETAVSNPPAGVVIGGSFPVTDTVTNQGGTTAAASKTRYYLSTDAVRSNSDVLMQGTLSVPSLVTGASSTASKSVTVKAGTPEGTYFVLVCADDTRLVAESNEGNNCRASATTVVVTGPDLVETAVSNPPAAAGAGSSFAVTDSARNQGSAAAGATFTRYYLSLNATKGSTDILLGSRSVPALAAGVTSTATLTVTIPVGTAPNSYFVVACADDGKTVNESNEKNNCRASAAKVIVN